MTEPRLIPLTRGLFATVDASDYDWLMQWKWSASRQGRKGTKRPKWRAVRVVAENGKQRTILMHRQIAGPNENEVVDHDDGNSLNNRRGNLITCTQYRNCQNRNPDVGVVHAEPRVTSSRQKGVTWNRRQKMWVVQVKRRHIGCFDNETLAVEAAKAALGV